MYTHEDFERDVAQRFEFLQSEYGMHRGALHVAGPGCWVVYSNSAVKVVVERELGDYCGVSVQNLQHVKNDPLERSEFDLDEIVAVSGPKQQPRRHDSRTMADTVASAAETLRSAGATVLKGDFEPLHARQRKVVEAVRRNNPAASSN